MIKGVGVELGHVVGTHIHIHTHAHMGEYLDVGTACSGNSEG